LGSPILIGKVLAVRAGALRARARRVQQSRLFLFWARRDEIRAEARVKGRDKNLLLMV
jgi:hypothetical protein